MESKDEDKKKQVSSMNDSESKKLPERMKKIEVKPPSSPTTLLARNAVLVPSQVARLKQIESVRTGLATGVSSVSTGSATGNPRNKTALAPGHSLMDWIRLGSSGIDLTGVGGVTRNVTLKELAKHDKKSDAWIAIRGVVFNVTRYMDFHPGGVPELMKGVGKDATKMFEDVHAWVNYQSILQKCIVGRLIRSGGIVEPDKSIIDSTKLSSSRPVSETSNETIGKSDAGQTKSSGSATTFKPQVDWKQTTNSISFVYKPSSDESSVAYRLTRLNATEFVITIHNNNNSQILKHEYDLNADVNWPPSWSTNYENSEVVFTFTKCTGKLWPSYGNRSVSRETRLPERIYREYKVISNTLLCDDVHLFVLQSENYMEILPVGRHVEIKMMVMGMEASRLYTPVPASLRAEPMLTSYKPDCLCFMIKRYDDGALSPSMAGLKPGQILTLSNALGTFVVESFDDCTTIHMLAAGTGLTPMLAIIQRALARRYVQTLNLVNFNRHEKNIFYASELEKVAEDGKLKVTHVLSQPQESWKGRSGLVSETLLSELVGSSSKNSCVFICGPRGFMAAAKEAVSKLKWTSTQIHEFEG